MLIRSVGGSRHRKRRTSQICNQSIVREDSTQLAAAACRYRVRYTTLAGCAWDKAGKGGLHPDELMGCKWRRDKSSRPARIIVVACLARLLGCAHVLEFSGAIIRRRIGRPGHAAGAVPKKVFR